MKLRHRFQAVYLLGGKRFYVLPILEALSVLALFTLIFGFSVGWKVAMFYYCADMAFLSFMIKDVQGYTLQEIATIINDAIVTKAELPFDVPFDCTYMCEGAEHAYDTYEEVVALYPDKANEVTRYIFIYNRKFEFLVLA